LPIPGKLVIIQHLEVCVLSVKLGTRSPWSALRGDNYGNTSAVLAAFLESVSRYNVLLDREDLIGIEDY
jgi:hypothetical protein